jgi:uncharacterized membrane protein
MSLLQRNPREKREALWQELISKGFVSGDMPSHDDIESPWYIRTLTGFSAWLAALFLLGSLGAGLEFVFHNPAAAIVIGSVMLVLAYMMLDKQQNKDFANQFALAVSFAGQALIAYGLFDWSNAKNLGTWILIALVQAALAFVMPNSLHRTWSAFAAATALSFAFISAHTLFIPTVLIMIAVAYVWLNEFKWIEHQEKIKPIGYGLTFALLHQASTGLHSHLLLDLFSGSGRNFIQPWVAELMAGGVILYVVWQLLVRQKIQIPGRTANLAFAGAVILALASLEMFGTSIAVMVILLGYENGNRILTALGIASLLYSISVYYYLMHSTLLEKSQWLALLGIILLVASVLMRRVLFNNMEVDHAK